MVMRDNVIPIKTSGVLRTHDAIAVLNFPPEPTLLHLEQAMGGHGACVFLPSQRLKLLCKSNPQCRLGKTTTIPHNAEEARNCEVVP